MPAEVGTSSSLRHFDPGLRFNFLIKILPWNLGSGFVLRKNKEKKNERKKKKKGNGSLIAYRSTRCVYNRHRNQDEKKRGEGGGCSCAAVNS